MQQFDLFDEEEVESDSSTSPSHPYEIGKWYEVAPKAEAPYRPTGLDKRDWVKVRASNIHIDAPSAEVVSWYWDPRERIRLYGSPITHFQVTSYYVGEDRDAAT